MLDPRSRLSRSHPDPIPIPSRSPPIPQCLEEFMAEETLSSDNLWRCPRCKDFRQASKRFELSTCHSVAPCPRVTVSRRVHVAGVEALRAVEDAAAPARSSEEARRVHVSTCHSVALCPRVHVSQCRAVSTCRGVAVPRCVHVSQCRSVAPCPRVTVSQCRAVSTCHIVASTWQVLRRAVPLL